MAVTERVFERDCTDLQQAIENAETNLRSQLKDAAGCFLSQPPVHFLSMAHKLSENFGTIAIAFTVDYVSTSEIAQSYYTSCAIF